MLGGGPACPQAGSLLWTWEGTLLGESRSPALQSLPVLSTAPPTHPGDVILNNIVGSTLLVTTARTGTAGVEQRRAPAPLLPLKPTCR